MENRITQAARFVQWWAGLPPGKKLVTYLLSVGITVFLVSSVVVKILYKQIIANAEDTKAQLTEAKKENRLLQLRNERLEADFRNYLIESNREKENRIREKDSIMKLVQTANLR